MLKDFVKAAEPGEEEFKKELKEAQEKLNGFQMQIKEAKLPVMVIFAEPTFLLFVYLIL